MGDPRYRSLQYGLLFERFLNPERVNLPDIDVDFCMNRRGEVIHYVTKNTAASRWRRSSPSTRSARARRLKTWAACSKYVRGRGQAHQARPQRADISLGDAIKQEPGFAEARKDPRIMMCLKVAACRLEGLSRNCSVHAAGVVISPQRSGSWWPLYKTNRDEIVTQFDMNASRSCRCSRWIPRADHADADRDALRLIKKRHGVEIIPAGFAARRLPPLRNLLQGSPARVFQFESQGCATFCCATSRSRAGGFDRAQRALLRPGPIQACMVDDFIERKWGRARAVRLRN